MVSGKLAESRRVVLGKRRPFYGGMRGPESLSEGQIVEPIFQRGKFERRKFFIYMNKKKAAVAASTQFQPTCHVGKETSNNRWYAIDLTANRMRNSGTDKRNSFRVDDSVVRNGSGIEHDVDNVHIGVKVVKSGVKKPILAELMLATWNVLTCSNAGRCADEVVGPLLSDERPIDKLPYIVKEMRRIGIHILGIQETHKKGSGTVVRDDATLFFSGVAADWKGKGKVPNGVGIIVGKESLQVVLEVHNVSERIMWLGGCFNGLCIAVVVVYAPTEEYPIEKKCQFYVDVNVVVSTLPKKYAVKTILGDWNARIGEDIEGVWKLVRGPHIDGIQNEKWTFIIGISCKEQIVPE
jgi:hypothetical protein